MRKHSFAGSLSFPSARLFTFHIVFVFLICYAWVFVFKISLPRHTTGAVSKTTRRVFELSEPHISILKASTSKNHRAEQLEELNNDLLEYVLSL